MQNECVSVVFALSFKIFLRLYPLHVHKSVYKGERIMYYEKEHTKEGIARARIVTHHEQDKVVRAGIYEWSSDRKPHVKFFCRLILNSLMKILLSSFL